MRSKVYFTSDAHLGSGYHKNPMDVERRLVRWLKGIAPTAKAVYFLGDMFDYWFEYHSVAPQGHVRFLGQLGLMSDEGVEIHFFAGNHDVWFASYLSREIGAVIHHQPEVVELLGKRFRLSHGDREYRHVNFGNKALYHIFRSKICRKAFAAIHPRWTVGLALSWSLHSRHKGLKRKTQGRIPHAYHNDYFDVENEYLVRYAKACIEKHPEIDYYLFGHRHLMIDLALKDDRRVIILGDWLRYNSYVVWDGEHLYLDQFEPEELD